MNFDKKIIFVAPWFGRFAGGAEVIVRKMAVELIKRGIETIVLTTCSRSPYDDWWEDYYEEGLYMVEDVKTYRFKTNKIKEPYLNAVAKLTKGERLTETEKQNFFTYGINSDNLIKHLFEYINELYGFGLSVLVFLMRGFLCGGLIYQIRISYYR